MNVEALGVGLRCELVILNDRQPGLGLGVEPDGWLILMGVDIGRADLKNPAGISGNNGDHTLFGIRIRFQDNTGAVGLLSGSSAFAVLGNGLEAASALYSIGFIGLWLDKTGRYVFCHDGSDRDFQSFPQDTAIIIHPCYWNSLALSTDKIDEDVIIDIHDDYEPSGEKEAGRRALKDQRTRLLGQIHEDLRSIALGPSGREQFESWIRSAIHILLAGKLVNPVFVTSKVDPHGRDILAKNVSRKDFFHRIRVPKRRSCHKSFSIAFLRAP